MAPQRDFQKVANSITREAIPSGMFNGKAKQLYDCLYSLTRGAIVPTMAVRIARSELMKKSGIGAKVTLEQNLRRLIAAGLVAMKTIGGIQGGNEYTVYLPEEAIPSTPPSTGASRPSTPSGGENLGVLATLESRSPSPGLSVDSKSRSVDSKTSFKTKEEKTDDDAAARSLLRPIQKVVKVMTGRELSATDNQNLTELGEIIAMEFQIAAARTTVNVPSAFLATHIRRRLFKKEKSQMLEEQMLEEQAASDMQAAGAGSFTQDEVSKCPDCGGSSWWYPEGPEKGVAKCKHEKLGAES